MNLSLKGNSFFLFIRLCLESVSLCLCDSVFETESLFFFFFPLKIVWPWIKALKWLAEPAGPNGASLDLKKKTRLLNGASSGFGVGPAGRVRI